MITVPELQTMGRLGNQIFEMSAAISLAIENGDTYGFPRWPYEGRFPISGCFHEALPDGPLYWEPQFRYDPIPYQPNLRLHGYFQSQRYFAKNAALIRSLFTPFCSSTARRLVGWASIHVRRGDYVVIPHLLHNLSTGFFIRAADLLAREAGVSRFLVFSDDPEWCRRELRDPRFEVAAPASDVEHLAAMSACEHHIIANSTFSWWGAWLDPNPSKRVVAPSRWFGPDWRHHDISDLYPPGWTVVED